MFKFFRGRKPSKEDAKAAEVVAQESVVDEVLESDTVGDSAEQDAKRSKKSAKSEATVERAASENEQSASEKQPQKEAKSPKPKLRKFKTVDALEGEDAKLLAKNSAAITANGMKYVGEFVGLIRLDETTVAFQFQSNLSSYPAWRWVVVLSQLTDEDEMTVQEVVLLPSDNSLRAPEWIPWADRLKPSDITETDELPYEKDDKRLQVGPELAALEAEDQAVLENLAIERNRVLNVYGKSDLAARWYDGQHGPFTASTRIAKASCSSCAFYIPLSGDLGQIFGACGNSWSRDDGRVVSADHGCGMHSETDARGQKRWNQDEQERVVDDTPQVDEFDLGDPKTDEFDLDSVADNEAPESDNGKLVEPAEESTVTDSEPAHSNPAE